MNSIPVYYQYSKLEPEVIVIYICKIESLIYSVLSLLFYDDWKSFFRQFQIFTELYKSIAVTIYVIKGRIHSILTCMQNVRNRSYDHDWLIILPLVSKILKVEAVIIVLRSMYIYSLEKYIYIDGVHPTQFTN